MHSTSQMLHDLQGRKQDHIRTVDPAQQAFVLPLVTR